MTEETHGDVIAIIDQTEQPPDEAKEEHKEKEEGKTEMSTEDETLYYTDYMEACMFDFAAEVEIDTGVGEELNDEEKEYLLLSKSLLETKEELNSGKKDEKKVVKKVRPKKNVKKTDGLDVDKKMEEEADEKKNIARMVAPSENNTHPVTGAAEDLQGGKEGPPHGLNFKEQIPLPNGQQGFQAGTVKECGGKLLSKEIDAAIPILTYNDEKPLAFAPNEGGDEHLAPLDVNRTSKVDTVTQTAITKEQITMATQKEADGVIGEESAQEEPQDQEGQVIKETDSIGGEVERGESKISLNRIHAKESLPLSLFETGDAPREGEDFEEGGLSDEEHTSHQMNMELNISMNELMQNDTSLEEFSREIVHQKVGAQEKMLFDKDSDHEEKEAVPKMVIPSIIKHRQIKTTNCQLSFHSARGEKKNMNLSRLMEDITTTSKKNPMNERTAGADDVMDDYDPADSVKEPMKRTIKVISKSQLPKTNSDYSTKPITKPMDKGKEDISGASFMNFDEFSFDDSVNVKDRNSRFYDPRDDERCEENKVNTLHRRAKSIASVPVRNSRKSLPAGDLAIKTTTPMTRSKSVKKEDKKVPSASDDKDVDKLIYGLRSRSRATPARGRREGLGRQAKREANERIHAMHYCVSSDEDDKNELAKFKKEKKELREEYVEGLRSSLRNERKRSVSFSMNDNMEYEEEGDLQNDSFDPPFDCAPKRRRFEMEQKMTKAARSNSCRRVHRDDKKVEENRERAAFTPKRPTRATTYPSVIGAQLNQAEKRFVEVSEKENKLKNRRESRKIDRLLTNLQKSVEETTVLVESIRECNADASVSQMSRMNDILEKLNEINE